MFNTLPKVFICWSIAIIFTQLNNEYVCSEHIYTSPIGNHSNCGSKPNVSQWNKYNFPNPQNDIQLDYCGRNCKASWICDPDRILSQDEGMYSDIVKYFGFSGSAPFDHTARQYIYTSLAFDW